MRKRVLILAMSSVLLLSVVFTACNKDEYKDPKSGENFIFVTDENRKRVLTDEGELLVYVTDSNGDRIEGADDEYVTRTYRFENQIVDGRLIEDYTYSLKLPVGWNSTENNGVFKNQIKGWDLRVVVYKQRFEEYYEDVLKTYNDILNEKTIEHSSISLDEYSYDYIDTKLYKLNFISSELSTVTLFFSHCNNLYIIRMTTENEFDNDEAQKEVLEIFESIEFKPYTYYEDLSDSVTLKDESTTVALTEVE